MDDQPLKADQPDDVAPTFRLTDLQIEQIVEGLRAGRPLPPHLFPHIFEAPKEYELSYRGKARRADVLSETMAVPLQPVKTFGRAKGWSNMLVFGDNLQVLKRLLQLREAGQIRNADGTDGVRLCYIDPPFATRREFVGSRNERAYEDRVAGAEFVEFLRRRLILIHQLLSSDGSLYVHLDMRKAHYIKVLLDELFGEHNFRNEIVWKRTVGTHGSAKRYVVVHDVLLYYTKSADPVWTDVREDYAQEYLDKYYRFDDGDGRLYWRADLTGAGVSGGETGQPWRGFNPTKKGRHWSVPPKVLDQLDAEGRIYWPPGGTGWPQFKRYRDELKGKPASDVWVDIDRMNSVATERTGFPTQKPEALMTRVIEASSRPGDLVLDCFAGSGSTLAAAEKAPSGPRRWIGVDSSKFAIYTTQARLLRNAGKRSPANAFTHFNAGLYDYAALRDLPWPAYKEFVLQLFQCRAKAETVGGVTFDGFMGDHRVLVYNFKEHPEAKIGRSFVEDLAAVLGERLGARCFIIAPAVTVEPYEDYIELDGTRFYFLRIPYSIIAELHKRAFSELRQPSSQDLLNATIDSVGFDFVTPPLVDAKYLEEEDDLVVQITHFESEAFAASDSAEDIANLAMVMVDYDYDGEVFDVGAVHFAEDLAKTNWSIFIPKAEMGKRAALVYLDVYGNEHREVRLVADFTAESARGRKSPVRRRPIRKKTTVKGTAIKKKTGNKKTAKKTTAKRTTAKKTTAKRTTAKKTTAKRTTAKKTTAKKTTAKKTSARTATARKPAKKASGRKESGARKRATDKAKAGKATGRKKATVKRAGSKTPRRNSSTKRKMSR